MMSELSDKLGTHKNSDYKLGLQLQNRFHDELSHISCYGQFLFYCPQMIYTPKGLGWIWLS